jgi:rhodanese-related sulfurtransferase
MRRFMGAEYCYNAGFATSRAPPVGVLFRQPTDPYRTASKAAHAPIQPMERFFEFASNHTIMVLALFTSFFLLVFSELRRKAGDVASIATANAVKLINSDAAVLDVRSAESFARGHIVNARNVPLDELEGRLDSLSSIRSKPVIVVCDAGITSKRALDLLSTAGFDTVYNLKGGMNGWQQDGLPVVSGKKTGKKK